MNKWTRTLWMPALSAAVTAALALGTASNAYAQAAPPAPPQPPAAPADPADPADPGDPANAVHVDVQGQAIIVDANGDHRVIRLAPDGNGQFNVALAQAAQADAARTGVWVGRQGKTEKAAFLGVTSTPADPALRAQLKLPRGIGLVIQVVQPGTPADSAGLQENDVITKIDDQWLVSSEQLGVLIRMHKADEEVTLTGVREGQPLTIKAKLAERDVLINPQGTLMPAQGGIQWQGQLPDVAALRDQVFNRFDLNDDAALIIREDDQTLKVSVKDGERHLVVTDNNDQTIFDGPVETDEQRKALPPDVAEKLEKYKEQFDQVKEAGPGQRKVKIVQEKK